MSESSAKQVSLEVGGSNTKRLLRKKANASKQLSFGIIVYSELTSIVKRKH